MRLYLSTGSPFVRKCRIVLREKGLLPRVEEMAIDFPYKTDSGHLAVNPIGQVPALIADDGTSFTNSPVICAYLDSLAPAPVLCPDPVADHWRARRNEVIGDGLNEMTVKLVMENRRPDDEQSPTWKGYWTECLQRAVDAAEKAAPDPSVFDLGSISLAVAATYLDFRRPDMNWREGRPKLAALTAAFEQRESFKETYPK